MTLLYTPTEPVNYEVMESKKSPEKIKAKKREKYRKIIPKIDIMRLTKKTQLNRIEKHV